MSVPDGNLLVTCGNHRSVKVYNKRQSNIVKTFDNIHDGKIYNFYCEELFATAFVCRFCEALIISDHLIILKSIQAFMLCVRWNPMGNMLASASTDGTAKLLDFRTEKVLHTVTNKECK